MAEIDGGGPACPPPCVHHWNVTTQHDALLGSVYHHRCIKCHLEKDVPTYNPAAGKLYWRKKV